MATITHLPVEMIEMILEYRNISLEDIVRFKSTCEIFQQISFSNTFWKKKYLQRYPTGKEKYGTIKQTKILDYLDYLDMKNQIETGAKCINQLQYYISLMSNCTLKSSDKNELEYLLRSIVENPILYCFALNGLRNIISAQLPRNLDSNLTREYNLDLIYSYLKQYRFIFIFKVIKCVSEPKGKQFLEQQLTLIVAQYFEPHIYTSYSLPVVHMLDDVVQEELIRLKNKYPKHLIFSTSVKQFPIWKHNNIDDNFWNETEAKQIMAILEKFIFSYLEIDKLYQLLIISDLGRKYINYISDNFRKHLLHFIYCSVARRLGYIFNLLYPSNIVKGKYLSILRDFTYSRDYIRRTRNMMFDFHQCLIKNNHEINNWEFNMFNLLNRGLTQIIRITDIDIDEEYKNITKSIEIRPNVVKRILSQRIKIKFAVGMIVAHSCKFYPNSERNNSIMISDGVIIGWHYICQNSRFIFKMKDSTKFPYLSQCCEKHDICVCKCSDYSANEPHYIILTQNNRICYVPQGHILRCRPREIDNIEIGRYFTRFEGTYYVPNESLAKDYPNDTVEILKILSVNNSYNSSHSYFYSLFIRRVHILCTYFLFLFMVFLCTLETSFI